MAFKMSMDKSGTNSLQIQEDSQSKMDLAQIGKLGREWETALKVREFAAVGRVVSWDNYLDIFSNNFNKAFSRTGYTSRKTSWQYLAAFRVYLGSCAILALNISNIFSVDKKRLDKSIESFQEEYRKRPEWIAFLKSNDLLFDKEFISAQIKSANEEQKKIILKIANDFLVEPEKREAASIIVNELPNPNIEIILPETSERKRRSTETDTYY